MNPLYWTGSLDDGGSADLYLFSFDIIAIHLAPGACARSQLDLQAPVGWTVTTVGVRDSIFQLVATPRTSAPRSRPPRSPLDSADRD